MKVSELRHSVSCLITPTWLYSLDAFIYLLHWRTHRPPSTRAALYQPKHSQESRKQSRRGKKEATKQAKKAKGGQDTHAITPSEGETTAHAAKKYEGDTKAIKPKAKRKLAKIFHIRLREPPPPSSSSRTPTVTITAASPPAGEDPFQDPAPAPKKAKPKTEKARKKEKMKEKWRKKTTRSLEAHDNAQDPFRDPEPMSLIDADDFRLESSEDTG